MAQLRTPFQGVWNVIRFNWHFYFLSTALLLLLICLKSYFGDTFGFYSTLLVFIISGATLLWLYISVIFFCAHLS
jgi:hypothetical protein